MVQNDIHFLAVARISLLIQRKNGGINVIRMGKGLEYLDKVCDGFWILDIANREEYYSPKFRKVLGFEGEHDFPNAPTTWMEHILPDDAKKAKENFYLHLADPRQPFLQEVTYIKKGGEKIRLLCKGTIINRENPNRMIMIGTHEVI